MADQHSFTELPLVRGELLEIRPGRRLSVAHRPGTRQADTVVFFGHGGGGHKDQWRELWRSLGEQGYSLVAWDLLGHGDSEKPRQPAAYAWDELVADQLQIIKRYAGRRNLLVAHSFGTGLALSALLEQPRRLPEVSVAGALLLGTTLQRPLSRGGLMALPAWLLEIVRPLLSRGFRQRAWHSAVDPALLAYEEQLTRRNRLYVFKALLQSAQWPDATALAGLALPTRVLAGDSDGLTPASGGEALARQLPKGSFQLLEQCGHQLMLERPAQVLAAFQALLESLERPVVAAQG
ncbi:Lysophospholipase, alpha-beta hydrolase superfamily [Pseudomonas sp. LAMO17WK12:I10]|uniref:alpha/beta fold hydrolase n=1 Tax=unclassified Pseudomonas TaxID=196821 RepID=UPI000BC7294F|nr:MULTISPECIES: alpha/beta hydrolase [unclassified Pseudomonas]PXX64440.1 alpha-beta hydrolase superfamily lysophospholipase [Pseudomonas sp. LAMO17WK12:I9]SNY39173.1 Lysophospholipase, alpha-beta hydrolase superfamily [Pseudomonas sp. LAMO17WK12:I10]